MMLRKKVTTVAIASIATIGLSIGIISIIPPYDDEWSKVKVGPDDACQNLAFYGRYCVGAIDHVTHSCDTMTTMAEVKQFAVILTKLCLQN